MPLIFKFCQSLLSRSKARLVASLPDPSRSAFVANLVSSAAARTLHDAFTQLRQTLDLGSEEKISLPRMLGFRRFVKETYTLRR
jgi:hypothetical protein